jgi:ATP-dependent Lon protease
MSEKSNILARELSYMIHKGTQHELADTFNMAEILNTAFSMMDSVKMEFSIDLFVAVSLCTVHEKSGSTLYDVLNFPLDPGWDSTRQMLCHLSNCADLPMHEDTIFWLKGFSEKAIRLEESRANDLASKSHAHWKKTLNMATEIPTAGVVKKKSRPRRSVQVFNPEQVGLAMKQLLEMNQEKRAGGERILDNALLNDGFRIIPNAKKASVRLENAKANFENLQAPLNRLQLDLVLSGAMAPEDFHIMPILLLGDPGIGKTYLASQLADALSVDMEKLSAGGAQGAFQINGSHSGWNNAKFGSMISVLATGKTSSPVVLIDEVDKIGSSQQYPILPALLDLLESRSAKCFKDEFFGMEFDCSRMIFVLTANTIESVPTPLLSRLNVFDVPRPEPTQRLRIIKNEIKHWQRKTRHSEIAFDLSVCNELAERIDLDLRKTTDLVREGFGRAIRAGVTVAELSIPEARQVRSIGF